MVVPHKPVHDRLHPHHNKRVLYRGQEYVLHDWLDRMIGGPWKQLKGMHKLATRYHHLRSRMGKGAPPQDDNVVALKMPSGRSGWEVAHVSQLEFVDE